MKIDLGNDPALAAAIAVTAAAMGLSPDDLARRALLAGLRELGRRSMHVGRVAVRPPEDRSTATTPSLPLPHLVRLDIQHFAQFIKTGADS